jgi:hypothetical protein
LNAESTNILNARPNGRIRLAYVHDAPGQASIKTKWRNPAFLATRGFTDTVVADQMSGATGLALIDADPSIAEPLLDRIESRIAAASAAGLGSWIMDDLWTLSRGFDACPASQEAATAATQAFVSLAERFPNLTGFIIRIGERFDSPRDWVERYDPLACECEKCADIDIDERRRTIVRFAEQTICQNLGKMCILRLWDLGEEGAHAVSGRAAEMLSAWNGDRRLIVSLKHTMTDYWRYQPWNPSLTKTDLPCLIELQCEREYEFTGHTPNWLGEQWANGPVECLGNGMNSENSEPDEAGERGLTKSSGFANGLPKDWAGVYVLPRGGGWSGVQAKNDIWADLNISTAIALTNNPNQDPVIILNEWLKSRQLPKKLAPLIARSSDRMLALRYPKVWREFSNSIWMPAENWVRDDTFVAGALARMATTIAAAGRAGAFVAERQNLVDCMASDLKNVKDILSSIDHPDVEFIIESYQFMHRFADWTFGLWSALLAASPIQKSIASELISLRLTNHPIPPFRLL